MEKHKCKLCARRFGSGRALGGHMRSHFTILPVPTKTQLSQLSEISASSSSSSELKHGKKRRRSTESMSETSSEEDLAMCLVLLSRDKWVRKEQHQVGKRENIFLETRDEFLADAKTKIHECPVCCKVFKSGQALGGHKRSHLLTSTAGSTVAADVWVIDLNLPAPLEDGEEINQSQVPVLCVN